MYLMAATLNPATSGCEALGMATLRGLRFLKLAMARRRSAFALSIAWASSKVRLVEPMVLAISLVEGGLQHEVQAVREHPGVRIGHQEFDVARSEEHTSELQSLRHLVCRLLLEKNK